MSILIPIVIVASALGASLALYRGERSRAFANSTCATHRGSVTRLTDAAVSTRNLLGTNGSDASHIALCGASNVPLGIIADEASAAGEDVAVLLLGSSGTTLGMVAAGAINAGSLVYTAANGRVSALSATAGTYYCVGVALTAATTAGDSIEVDPSAPQKTVV
ncbi:MAG TPA: DUF2190 family protein [Opitutales bacterium]|nr:DUF2190 family protein [Opitutales bacterium]